MKEVKLSEVCKSAVGILIFGEVIAYRFSGTKDLHDSRSFKTDLLMAQFYNGHVELHIITEDEEYILINDNEISY